MASLKRNVQDGGCEATVSASKNFKMSGSQRSGQVEPDSTRPSAVAVQLAVENLLEGLDNILTQMQLKVKENVQQFIQHGVKVCGASMKLYKETLQSLNVSNQAELESHVKQNYRHRNVREKFEDLLDVERDWNKLLSDVENSQSAKRDINEISMGEAVPDDLELLDVMSEKVVSLRSVTGGAAVLLVLLRHFA